MKRVWQLFPTLWESMIRNIGGGLGRRIRYRYYRKRLGDCGQNVIIDVGVIIQSPAQVFLGDNVWIDNYVVIIAGSQSTEKRKFQLKTNDAYEKNIGELHIAEGVHVGPHVVIQSHGGVAIGQNTCLAAGVKLYSMSHHYRNLNEEEDKQAYFFSSMASVESQFLIVSPVVVGNGCAVGLNSVILPGATIPDGTWIGVNTYVKSEALESNAIYISEAAKLHKKKKS